MSTNVVFLVSGLGKEKIYVTQTFRGVEFKEFAHSLRADILKILPELSISQEEFSCLHFNVSKDDTKISISVYSDFDSYQEFLNINIKGRKIESGVLTSEGYVDLTTKDYDTIVLCLNNSLSCPIHKYALDFQPFKAIDNAEHPLGYLYYESTEEVSDYIVDLSKKMYPSSYAQWLATSSDRICVLIVKGSFTGDVQALFILTEVKQ